MYGMTNYRNRNEDLDEPLPKRVKLAQFDASTTHPTVYEERRYDNNCMMRPKRGEPQRERRFKPNKWSNKENMMPRSTDSNKWSRQGFRGFSGSPPHSQMPWQMQMQPSADTSYYVPQFAGVGGFRVPSPNMTNLHPQMPWQMQMPPSGDTTFVPQFAGVGGYSGAPPFNMQPQMPWQMQIPTSYSLPFVQPSSVMRTSPTQLPQTPQTPVFPPLNKINIEEIFQKLVSSGILRPAAATAPEEEVPQSLVIQPIDLAKRETIKTRRMAPVDTLYSGMQCSNCCKRFSPKETIEYGRHLDWHFHQNRHERNQSREARSRGWYSSIGNWMQQLAEELENYEPADKTSNPKRLDSPMPPNCPALPVGEDKACEICQEKLEQFYHDETEEWHLRNAIRVDDNIYHPLCSEDYKVDLSKISTLNAKGDEDVKRSEKAAAPPSNWTEWKALNLQLMK